MKPSKGLVMFLVGRPRPRLAVAAMASDCAGLKLVIEMVLMLCGGNSEGF